MQSIVCQPYLSSVGIISLNPLTWMGYKDNCTWVLFQNLRRIEEIQLDYLRLLLLIFKGKNDLNVQKNYKEKIY